MMSDNFEVAALAEATACREELGVCGAEQTYVERNPFAETPFSSFPPPAVAQLAPRAGAARRASAL